MSVKKVPCPVCNKDMEYAGQEGGHKERAKSGEVIETVHVFFMCEKCDTSVRLRFRKDGQTGDLWREIQRRKAVGKVVTDFGGKFGEMG